MKVLKGIGFIVIFLAVLALGVFVTMLLWNALIPSIIGWTTITYWQALGLMILCRLLFTGFGKGHHHKWGKKGHSDKHLHKMMKNMSREERREFVRERMFGGKDDFRREKPVNDDGGQE